MKKIVFTLLISMLALTAGASQPRKVTAAQQRQMIEQVNRTAAAIRTVQCTFVQTKKMSFLNDKMVSHGRMYYTDAGRLRWEYTTPYAYTFVINNGRVTMKSAKKTNTVNLASSRLFQSIARVMVSSVTGKSLSSSGDFAVQMYTHDGQWVAYLTPRKSEMKKMFKQVRLHFNAAHSMVSRVELIENNGDTTVIDLKDVKTNAPISDSVFTVK